jgi:hypothetical protein
MSAGSSSSSSSSSSSKKLINEPGSVVTDAIDGFLATHPHLKRLDGFPDIKVPGSGTLLLTMLYCQAVVVLPAQQR